MESEWIVKFVPLLIPFLGVVALIFVIKKQLLAGLVPQETFERIFSVEKVNLEFQTKFEEKIITILGQLAENGKITQEVKGDLEELKHLTYEHNTQTRELLTSLRKRQDDFLSIKATVGLLLVFVLCCSCAASSRQVKPLERDYQAAWCAAHDGKTEVVLSDRTRVDCITATHAVEFDFARKWAEAIGQSLHYSSLTGKQAGIVLIVKQPQDQRLVRRLQAVIRRRKLDITVWTIGN